ncbi:hypothetical protein [Pseudomonas sp. 25 E 4]|nr:hypothetical protein [Pseudomonas sp. 25 E 4]
MKKTFQSVDLLISHSQIQFRSRPFDEASSQWGKVNLEQGAVLHSDYIRCFCILCPKTLSGRI